MKIHPHLILPSQNSTQLQPQFSSPPPSMLTSPGSIYAGVDEGGRLSHSPNQLNTHACSHGSCSASFPTFELLEKHEIINHSSGATSVVCTELLYYSKSFLRFSTFFALSRLLVHNFPSLVAVLVFLFSLPRSHFLIIVAPAFAPFFFFLFFFLPTHSSLSLLLLPPLLLCVIVESFSSFIYYIFIFIILYVCYLIFALFI